MKIVKSLLNKKNIVYQILLALILILAFLLRSKTYLQGDFNYTIDQARDLLLVNEIIEKNKPTLIGGRTGFGGIFHGPLWLYIILPFFIVTKGDPFFTLVPLFIIFDLGIIIISYLLFSRLYGKTAGILFSFFLSISNSLISSSFNFSNANLMPLVFLIYLFACINFIRGKNNYLPLIFFLTGLGFQFQSAFAIFLLPLTLLLIILRGNLPSIKIFLFGFFSFFLSISSFILFDIRHDFLMTRAALRLFSGKTPPMRDYEQFAKIDFRIIDRLNSLKDYFFRPLFEENLLIKILLIIIISIGITYIFKTTKNKKSIKTKTEFIFLLIIPTLYYFLYIIYPYPLWSHYTLPLTISSCLLTSFIIFKLFQIKSQFLKIMIFTLLFLSVIQSLRWILTNYNPENFRKETGNYQKQLQVAKYIFESAKQKSFGYLVYDHGQLTYHMDYLMQWLAKRKYHLSIVNNKQLITFLIMYDPPIFAKDAHKYWKENVIKTKGLVLDKKIFPDRIIVEKLKINVEKEEPVDPNYFQNLIFR